MSPSRLAYARGSCVTIVLFTRPSTVTMTVTWLQTQSCLLKKILSLYAVFSAQIEDAEYNVWTRTPSFLLPYRNQEVLQSIGRVKAVAIEGLSLKDIPHWFQPSARAVPLCRRQPFISFTSPRDVSPALPPFSSSSPAVPFFLTNTQRPRLTTHPPVYTCRTPSVCFQGSLSEASHSNLRRLTVWS